VQPLRVRVLRLSIAWGVGVLAQHPVTANSAMPSCTKGNVA